MKTGFARLIGSTTIIIAATLLLLLALARPIAGVDEISVGTARCTAVLDEAKQYGDIVRVVTGDQTTMGDVVAWQEAQLPGLQSSLRAEPPDDQVTVCVYQGTFSVPVAPPLPGSTPAPAPDTIRLLVWPSGKMLFDSAGPGTKMQPLVPASLRQAP